MTESTEAAEWHQTPAHISTSFVERQNLTMRMSMRRFTRLTNGFSQEGREAQGAPGALRYMFYNFGRIHKTLRVTPAMEGREGGSRVVARGDRSTHTLEEGDGHMAKKGDYQAVKLRIAKDKVLKLHTSESIAAAVKEVKEHLKQTRPYEAVRFRQAFEAVYKQGKKDGAGQVFEGVDSLKTRIAHRPPSRSARRSS